MHVFTDPSNTVWRLSNPNAASEWFLLWTTSGCSVVDNMDRIPLWTVVGHNQRLQESNEQLLLGSQLLDLQHGSCEHCSHT